MKKLALAATLDAAYGFFFRNIISIVGIVWFPALVFACIAVALVLALVPHEWLTLSPATVDLETFVTTRLPVFVRVMPLVGLAGLVTISMMRVGILERALDNRAGLTLFYFSLGSRVWRMAGGTILAGIALSVVAIVEVVIGVALHFAMSAVPGIGLGWVILFDIVQTIALLVVLAYIGVRVCFFLPAAIVAENRIGFRRSWSLASGNVGRAIVIILAIVIPVWFVSSIVSEFAILPTFFPAMTKLGSQPDPAQAAALLKAMLPVLPILAAVHLIGALVMTGTLLGAIGKAYRAVTADETV
jgi:hypothetical protein